MRSKFQAFNLFSALTEAEFREFRSIVRHSGKKDSFQKEALVEALYKHYPDYSEPSKLYHNLRRKLYPVDKIIKVSLDKQEKKSISNFRRLMSDTVKLLRTFLVLKSLEKREMEFQWLLFDTLLERKLIDESFLVLRSLEKKLHERMQGDSSAFYWKMQIDELKYLWIEKSRASRKYQFHFDEYLFHLDNYYIINKIKFSCQAVLEDRIREKEPVNNFLLEEILEGSAAGRFQKGNFALKMYRLLLLMFLKKDNSAYFEEWKSLLPEAKKKLSEQDWNDIKALMSNFFIAKINQGDFSYRIKLFKYYQKIDEEGLLAEGGRISAAMLKNVISTAAQIRELPWAEERLKRYLGLMVPKDSRQAMKNFLEGTIAFYGGNYRLAQYFLLVGTRGTKGIDKFTQYDRDTLLLRAYYELSEEEEFGIIFIRILKRLKSDKQINRNHKTRYKNFISYCNRLFSIKMNIKYDPESNMKKLQKLQTEISQERSTFHKDWLSDQIATITYQFH